MKSISLILFLLLSSYTHANFIEVQDKKTVVRKQELEDRIRTLEKAVQELQIKMQHLSSGAKLEDLKVFHCTLEAPLIGSFSEAMPNREQTIQRLIQNCRSRTSNASACNSSNVKCAETPFSN
jgi:hypothetical protein